MACNSYTELYHYGVLGMKWGMHKAKKNGTEYNYRSFGQKRYQKKLAKAQSKGRDTTKIEARLEGFKKRDAARQSYAESTKTGHAVARALLLGPYGAGSYNRARAAGMSVGKSATLGVLSAVGIPITMGAAQGYTAAAEYEKAGLIPSNKR